MPQEPFLFDDTIAANVGFAVEHSTRADVERVVDELDVGDWVESLPDGPRRPVSASAAISCPPVSVSSWRCCAPGSPTRTS